MTTLLADRILLVQPRQNVRLCARWTALRRTLKPQPSPYGRALSPTLRPKQPLAIVCRSCRNQIGSQINIAGRDWQIADIDDRNPIGRVVANFWACATIFQNHKSLNALVFRQRNGEFYDLARGELLCVHASNIEHDALNNNTVHRIIFEAAPHALVSQ